MGAAAVPLLIGGQVAGAGLGAYGAYQQGLAQQRYYKYQAAGDREMADLTEKQGQRDAISAEDEGAYENQLAIKKQKETEGSQTVAEAANGIAGSVTAVDIAKDTMDKAALDRMAIKYNADLKSYKSTQDAAARAYGLRREAAGYEAAGEEARRAGKIGAIGSLLGGATQVGSTGLAYGKFGKG